MEDRLGTEDMMEDIDICRTGECTHKATHMGMCFACFDDSLGPSPFDMKKQIAELKAENAKLKKELGR